MHRLNCEYIQKCYNDDQITRKHPTNTNKTGCSWALFSGKGSVFSIRKSLIYDVKALKIGLRNFNSCQGRDSCVSQVKKSSEKSTEGEILTVRIKFT